MIYAVTYMPDDYTDSVDTTIVEADSYLDLEQHISQVLRSTGMSKQRADKIIKTRAWYARNCNDIDYKVGE